jgi:hypothetical protein
MIQDLHLAYIDPGAGSILIQVIIGTVLAVPYLLRRQIGRVFQALRQRRPTGSNRGSERTTLDR